MSPVRSKLRLPALFALLGGCASASAPPATAPVRPAVAPVLPATTGPVLSTTWVADNSNGTYSNPLFFEEFSDPDVIRVGQD